MTSPHGLSAVAPPPDRGGTSCRPERQTTGSITESIAGSADRPTTGRTAADRIGSSAIRDLLALTERPGVISLAGGLPDLDLLDPERIRAAADHAASVSGAHGPVALQYGPTAGLATLREVVADRLGVDADEVVITTGSQQGLDLLARSVIAPGDEVALQEPAYLGAVQAFRAAGATVVGLPGDDRGLDVDALSARIAAGNAPRVVYVVADHHNPTGAVMSPGRRVRLRELADANGILVIEDAAYRDLRWGPPTRPLFAPRSPVVHVGSASKVLAPGLRVGWMTGPTDVIDAVLRLKQAADLHTPTWNQLMVAHLLDDGHQPRHLERIRTAYRSRAVALADELTSRLGDAVEVTPPDGGMFLWMTTRDGTDTDGLLDRAIEAGVAFVPGSAFRTRPPGSDTEADHTTARLAFASRPEEQLRAAARRLAEVWRP